MNSFCRPRLEILEDRDVPSIFGVPWPDADHLTLSLAPDGANISGSSSSLSQVLAAAGPQGELALLRAFQTWADYADINFGLVADGGQPFGVAKAIQDDPRFGDIRVGAIPLATDVVAITSPFNYIDTYSGDVILNSQQPIGTTYDLYTVALHEAGHALGLPDNNDPTSVMYGTYTGAVTGLSATDIANIQALYGVRAPASANDSITTAIAYNGPVYNELNSPGDSEYYEFNTGLALAGTTIHLQAQGLSLLDARISVFNSSGDLVASATASDPTNNDLTLDLGDLHWFSNYYVRVDSPSGGVFDVGSYQLTIQNNLLGTVSDVLGGTVDLLGNLVDNTLASATNLIPSSVALDAQVNYAARASLSANASISYYSFQAPPSPTGATENFVTTVWSLTNPNLAPRVQIFDSSGDPVAAQVLTNDNGGTTVQVIGAAAGQNYYMSVDSATNQTGNYGLAIEFRTKTIRFPMTATGTLNSSRPSSSADLVVNQSAVMHLVLAIAAVPSDPQSVVMMTIVDGNGDTVAQLQVTAGDAESIDIFLPAGSYTVSVSAASGNGGPLANTPFQLSAIGITGPIGAQASDPTSNPDGGNPPPLTDSGGSGTSCQPASWTGTTPNDPTQWC